MSVLTALVYDGGPKIAQAIRQSPNYRLSEAGFLWTQWTDRTIMVWHDKDNRGGRFDSLYEAMVELLDKKLPDFSTPC